ncbi:MAG: HDOD domain-containing protein [Defluviitaleaceae bacterium]|nr:HDOD domain-containing protein [Defluviitaleaceae bacterium]
MLKLKQLYDTDYFAEGGIPIKFFIVPKPILAKDMSLYSYVLRQEQAHDYVADAPARLFDGVVTLPGLKILEDVGLNAFTAGAPLFVPINVFSLLSDITQQCSQPPDKIVFLLDSQIPPEAVYIDCIQKLKEKGFRFAIENVTDFDRMDSIVQLCSYIVLGFKFNNLRNLDVYKRISPKYKNHIFIASEVNSAETFLRLENQGFDYFEGRFYNVPISKEKTVMSPVKINRMQLLNTVREDDFVIEEVVKIVSRDPSMSISLLRLVNSPYLGISQKIKSIQHAIAMLGQLEVRKWVTTVISGLLSEDKPSELTRLSLLRAKFAENLATSFEMGMQAGDLFMMGLFSILDVALEMPMNKALELIKVTDEIAEVLINKTGRFRPVMELVESYETANWTQVKNIIAIHNIEPQNIFNAYIDTIKWYDSVISMADDFVNDDEE